MPRWEVPFLTKKTSLKGKKAALLRLGSYLFRHKLYVITAFALMLASNLLALLGPSLSAKAINAINLGVGKVDMDTVTKNVILMVIVYAASALMSFLLAALLVKLGQKITYTLRKEVFDHLLTLPAGYFDTHQTGDIVSHISYDIDTVNASLSHDLLQICASVVTVAGSLGYMLSISPVLIGVFAVTVPISILFTRYKTKRTRPLFKRRSAKLGELNGYAEEMLSGQRTIRIYGREKDVCNRFDDRNAQSCDAYYEADYHGAIIGPGVNFINNLSVSLVTLIGGIFFMLSLTGALPATSIMFLNLGDLSAFVQYSRKFAGPINEFANILADLQSALAAADRIFGILDTSPEAEDDENAIILDNVKGDVEIKNVTFGYDADKAVIKDMSVKVPAGSVTAIVGPTGAGKTTLINLLMRFYDVNEGSIAVDGKDIRLYTRDSLRKAYTMVLQETWLFGGTIAENIAYGKEDATREQIEHAAKQAHIDGFINTLPDGYDTVITDNGVSISKGQKQLITIARAFLADAPMLILDEATSNVDSRTEKNIQSAMRSLMEGRTCFVIAHRLSTIKEADNILVMRDGRITEQGTHDSLMEQGGFYASLYNSQFDTAE
ncbi:MAG: ABC transporter ATP-binding protein [Clostridia bacterium]|nr:ABC transporter ATP-binding protein [Clostridia bacterium]